MRKPGLLEREKSPLTHSVVYSVACLIWICYANVQDTVQLDSDIVRCNSRLRNNFDRYLFSTLNISDFVDYWDIEIEA